MPPPTVDEAIISARLSTLSELLEYLGKVNPVSHADLINDDTKRYALERVLMKAVEVSSDVCAHVLISEFKKPVVSCASSFEELAVVGVINKALSVRLQSAAEMRSALKRDYLNVDSDIVARSSAQAQADFSEFRTAIARWLQENQHSQS